MKLRNKKTGEIGKLQPYGDDGRIWVWVDNMSKPEYRYDSLAKLGDEWEDYEEPKGWYVTMYGGISRITKDDEILISDLEEIGNRFNDKESAYDALDKLKAWTRLKDKGFKFKRFREGVMGHEVNIYAYFTNLRKDEIDDAFDKNKADLDLLFGGEE